MSPVSIARDAIDRHRQEYAVLLVDVFNHQPSGVEAVQRDLRLLSTYLHDKAIASLDGNSLLGFISHLKLERENSSVSINRKISSVKEYIRFLRFRQVEGAGGFPIESLRRARGRYRGPVNALLPGEVRRILEGIDRYSVLGFRDLLLFSLIYRLGLRLGEALAVDLSDLDLQVEVVRIHGKGRRERTLPLPEDLLELIRDWLMVRTKLRCARKTPALFLSKKGNRLAARTAQESFQKLVEQAGPLSLTKVTPHSLRHAFASHALDGKADLIVLKSLLGHACLKSTEIYLHPSMAILRRAIKDHPAAEVLDDLIADETIVLRVHQLRSKRAA
jgi:site-specific recombinase XerD